MTAEGPCSVPCSYRHQVAPWKCRSGGLTGVVCLCHAGGVSCGDRVATMVMYLRCVNARVMADCPSGLGQWCAAFAIAMQCPPPPLPPRLSSCKHLNLCSFSCPLHPQVTKQGWAHCVSPC